tara:strand:+ start:319 stop:633 length:315 start_codon:yes stop_codon:yes gene_type:complete
VLTTINLLLSPLALAKELKRRVRLDELIATKKSKLNRPLIPKITDMFFGSKYIAKHAIGDMHNIINTALDIYELFSELGAALTYLTTPVIIPAVAKPVKIPSQF